MTKKPFMGKCRLCLNSAELQRSHIVPEYFYDKSYDKKGRAMVIPKKGAKVQIAQKGARVSLLCEKCEKFLNEKYEQPFHKYWSPCVNSITAIHSEAIVLKGFDYRIFKLLHLSILWRYLASKKWITVEPVFEVKVQAEVDLLREILLTGDLSKSSSYSLYGACVVDPGTRMLMRGLIIPPQASEHDGYWKSGMFYDGFYWMIQHPRDPRLNIEQFKLTANGEIICHVWKSTEFRPLLEFTKSMSPELINNANRFANRPRR